MPYSPAAENYAIVRDSLTATAMSVFRFRGRSRRRDVWIYALASQILEGIILAASATVLDVSDKITLSLVINLIQLLPLPALLVRRMHDVGLAGWWSLLLVWPVINWAGSRVEALVPSLPYPFLTAGPVWWIGLSAYIIGMGIVLFAPSRPEPALAA